MQPRIVSLIPSGTEIVSALGYRDRLVGRSHECDYPSGVEQLVVCSEPRINVRSSSAEIDEAVKSAVREALSVYSVFRDELERLAPTHIITQAQCEVCAVSLKDVESAVCEMLDLNPTIVSLEPMSLADIWSDIRRVAEALDNPERGEALIADLQRGLDRVAEMAAGQPERPSVFCLEWLSPLMSAGNWVPELVEIAGGTPVLCKAGEHSPYLAWEELLTADPDVIAIMPCGFDIPRSVQEMEVLENHAAWQQLSAVRGGRVFVTDGNQYFNRPGPRVLESAEILFELLHREPPFRHQHTGWRHIL